MADAFRAGKSVDEVYLETNIDPWFLAEIEDLVLEELGLSDKKLTELDFDSMLSLKRKGFADRRLADLLSVSEKDIRDYRRELGVSPVFKRVDTCAAEFPTSTAYLYSTYEEECKGTLQGKRNHGVRRWPQSNWSGIEFDYCCVHAALAMREDGYETIMVNCNPETVSTDYDTSDRLYFEPLKSRMFLR